MTKQQIVRYVPRGQGTIGQVSKFVQRKLMSRCKSADDTSSLFEEGAAAMNDTRDTVGLDLSFMMGGGNDDRRQTRISE